MAVPEHKRLYRFRSSICLVWWLGLSACLLPEVGVTAAGAGAQSTGTGGRSGNAGETESATACDGKQCNANYPCRPRSKSYTCRGQMVDWTPAYASSMFRVASNETVLDERTRLVWQQKPPTTYPGCTGRREAIRDTCKAAEAGAFCAGLELAGGGWRLPTKAELESLVDERLSKPAIDPDVFFDTPVDGFWTSSPLAGSSSSGTPSIAWYVNFNDGASSNASVNFGYRVRCVRSADEVSQ